MRIGGGRTRSRLAWRPAMAVGALAVAFAIAAWIPTAQPAPAGPRIDIRNHKYSQATITVGVGTTVTWVNQDGDVHTVVSTAQAFVSPAIETDEAYSYTFSKPGTYQYFCTLHPLMTGMVIVK